MISATLSVFGNFDRPFTCQTWHLQLSNFVKTCFRRLPTFHLFFDISLRFPHICTSPIVARKWKQDVWIENICAPRNRNMKELALYLRGAPTVEMLTRAGIFSASKIASTVSCVAVIACTVVISPSLIPNLSFTTCRLSAPWIIIATELLPDSKFTQCCEFRPSWATFARGARQFVVHDALLTWASGDPISALWTWASQLA